MGSSRVDSTEPSRFDMCQILISTQTPLVFFYPITHIAFGTLGCVCGGCLFDLNLSYFVIYHLRLVSYCVVKLSL